MPWFRIFFLVAVLAVTSGYRFRCYWLCIDQTGVQDDYVEQRDRCRDYAQLKLDMALREASGPVNDTTRKTKLVELFSDCMGHNGWSVPSGHDDAGSGGNPSLAPVAGSTPFGQASVERAAPPPAAAAAPVPAPIVMQNASTRAYLARQSECDFARQAAPVSSISANRAKACDLECAQRLRLAPDAPRPAACPTDTPDALSTGSERN